MLDLLLVGMFTAFFLAAFAPLVEVLAIFINKLFINIVLSLGFSYLGNYLLGKSDLKELILWTVACSYFGSALLLVAEKIATYRPAVINQSR